MRKKECFKGHKLTPSNSVNRSDGTVRCRKCNKERALKFYHAKGKFNRHVRQAEARGE